MSSLSDNSLQRESLSDLMKEVGGQLIDLTQAISSKMIKRSEDSRLPFDMEPGECVGFTMKKSIEGSLDMYADLLVKTADNPANLRISGIILTKNSEGNDVFNSITLFYNANDALATEVTSIGANAEREDIKKVLHDQNTTLISIRHSNNSSYDETKNSRTGNFYDIELNQNNNELMINTNNEQVNLNSLRKSIDEVLGRFKEDIST